MAQLACGTSAVPINGYRRLRGGVPIVAQTYFLLKDDH